MFRGELGGVLREGRLSSRWSHRFGVAWSSTSPAKVVELETELKQDGAHEPECKHVRKATYVQMTLL